MVNRKCITLLYSYNSNWIGGTYYILNIIKSLNYLEDDLKPHLTILHDGQSKIEIISNIDYPYIEFKLIDIKLNFFERIVNKCAYYYDGSIYFKQEIPLEYTQNIYPLNRYTNEKHIKFGYFWIPDFQEKYMPELFSSNEVKQRVKAHKLLIKNNSPIVFSSETALNDFNKFYPDNTNHKEVLQFASIVGEDFKQIEVTSLLQKFNITKPYFIVCNQFWKHKNHEIILKAAKILAQKDTAFQIVLTGKEYDYRNKEYAPSLRKYVMDNGLESHIVFTGFIDRQEQLQLMNHSMAIVQPSLFEGWSTVVEDAKALNKYILVSDIPLHREQINKNCQFFEPKNSSILAYQLESVLSESPIYVDIHYDNSLGSFAKKFISLFDEEKS